MRQSTMLLNTLRDVPADAEAASHQLMLRAGLIKPLASGVYTFLPLGIRALRKLEGIVREEMNRAGAQEMLMPAMQPAELWEQSGRWDVYGPELMRLTDRGGRAFALGPTHEEVITSLLASEVTSYKQLPVTVYQIQTKYRDERRPRFGVLRSREFVMKDGYSFDRDQEGLDRNYQAMYNAYHTILNRCALNFRAVEADSGAIGGTGTHEFMVLADIGEDTIAYCPQCDYAANVEKAEAAGNRAAAQGDAQLNGMTADVRADADSVVNLDMTMVSTPGMKTVEEVSRYLEVAPSQIAKTIACRADGQIVLALVRGDHQLNEIKLKNLLGAEVIELLDEAGVRQELGSVPGFLGPSGLKQTFPLFVDQSLRNAASLVIGANQEDAHYLHARLGRDIAAEEFYDLRMVQPGDGCPRCAEALQFTKGIEVGHVFKLGTKYSEQLNATYVDENGREQLMIMGCYGIGVSRLLAAIIEQHHDERGIAWPVVVAPFHVHLLQLNAKDEQQSAVAEELYTALMKKGVEVLWDDRKERAGVKFNDADLLGMPIRITVGKRAGERVVECTIRKSGETAEVLVDQLENWVQKVIGLGG
ncbi:proline--tRNA ligase [Paenibacillus senegalensis]|uniref:proline--tRNA ligase n=1 Tax=Paenibacillus senegalensis TaxID=1465766 RepID=UPI000474DA66|nr:proline--tRNA ligase [Paenibacillus senegalensis]